MKQRFYLIMLGIVTFAIIFCSFSKHGHGKQIILSGYAMAKDGGAAYQVLIGVKGSTVACYSNEEGYYQLNITSVVDTSKNA